jgi:ankyrin repeat protein
MHRPFVAATTLAGLVACALAGCSATEAPSGPESGMVIDASQPLEPQARAAILADDLDAVEAVIAAGLDLSADLASGISPTHRGGYTPLHIAANAGKSDIVDYLLSQGAEVDATGFWGETPLMLAGYNGNAETVRLLVDAGASLTVGDRYDDTALHYAAWGNNPDTMLVLIDVGADLEQRNHLGETILLIAAHETNIEAIQVAIDAGADLEAVDNTGGTAVGLALVHMRKDVAAYLEAAGAR